MSVFFIPSIQIVTPPNGVDESFPLISYGHPQVQTVPSTTWVAPCPVVTPSHKGLARRFLQKEYSIAPVKKQLEFRKFQSKVLQITVKSSILFTLKGGTIWETKKK